MHARFRLRNAMIAVATAGASMALGGIAVAQAGGDAARFQKIMLGRYSVIAISDGIFQLATDQLLVGKTPGEVARILEETHQSTTQPTAVNAFLIDTGAKRILVDTGGGSLFGPSLGKILGGLKAAGYMPEAIDEILITHLHPDHVGGLIADGKVVFPNAIVRVDAAEQKFWLDKTNIEKVDASVKGSFDAAAATLEPYRALGHLKPFEPGAVLDPGVSAVASPGHTPGHTAFRVQSGGKTMLIWGDLMHVAPVQLKDPEVTIKFDFDRNLAVRSRLAMMKDAARKRYLVAGAHLQFPGVGTFRQVGSDWQWIPIAGAPIN